MVLVSDLRSDACCWRRDRAGGCADMGATIGEASCKSLQSTFFSREVGGGVDYAESSLLSSISSSVSHEVLSISC